MIVLYIILGIIVGVPAYLLLNTVFALLARLIAAMFVGLWGERGGSTSFMNEIKGGEGSMMAGFEKTLSLNGWIMLIMALIVFAIVLICRLVWLVYQVFRYWFKFVKFCRNLPSKTKNKTKTKTKTKTK